MEIFIFLMETRMFLIKLAPPCYTLDNTHSPTYTQGERNVGKRGNGYPSPLTLSESSTRKVIWKEN